MLLFRNLVEKAFKFDSKNFSFIHSRYFDSLKFDVVDIVGDKDRFLSVKKWWKFKVDCFKAVDLGQIEKIIKIILD